MNHSLHTIFFALLIDFKVAEAAPILPIMNQLQQFIVVCSWLMVYTRLHTLHNLIKGFYSQITAQSKKTDDECFWS